jgi:DnaA family protein
VLAAGSAPPAQLALREGPEKPPRMGARLPREAAHRRGAALYLAAEAERRGLRLPEDIVAYLLARVRRDLKSLARFSTRWTALRSSRSGT